MCTFLVCFHRLSTDTQLMESDPRINLITVFFTHFYDTFKLPNKSMSTKKLKTTDNTKMNSKTMF